jgi:hypothetical protein
MAQPGPSDYSTRHPSVSREHSEGMMDQVSEAGERAATMAGELGLAIKERPYATLAIAAGLAFAVGAVWKLGQRRPQSRLDSLLAQWPDLPSRERWLPSRWR